MSISNCNPLWGSYVRAGIADRRINRRRLAHLVGADQSSATLWCRGHVPKRATVERIGEVLNCPIEACRAAGYLHSAMVTVAETGGLSAKSRHLLAELGRLTPREQDRLTYSLRLALGQTEAVAG